MNKALLFLGFALSGCASVQQIAVRDGRPFYQADCRKSQADCHALASKTCDGKYQVSDFTTGAFDWIHMTFSCTDQSTAGLSK